MNKKINTYLTKIYYDRRNPASFSSSQRLYNYVKKEGKFQITKKEIQSFLDAQEVHTTHIEPRKAKNFYGMTVPYNNYLVQLDSFYFDFEGEPKKKIILGVDAFSRKGAARAVKSLEKENVNQAVKEIIKELKPQRVQFDRGREYNNSLVYSTLRKNNIKYIIANPPYKASMVERLARTLKLYLYKLMQHRGDVNWSKLLPQVIDTYNNRYHTSIGMTPNQAAKAENEADVWFKVRGKMWKTQPEPKKYEYELNDPVRVVNHKGPLEKSFYETFSGQVFFVSMRYAPNNVNRYKLKDANNNPVQDKSFTYNQLKLVNLSTQSVFRIQKVLHQKLIRGRLYSYVKWYNYDSSFNTYIPSSDILNLKTRK